MKSFKKVVDVIKGLFPKYGGENNVLIEDDIDCLISSENIVIEEDNFMGTGIPESLVESIENLVITSTDPKILALSNKSFSCDILNDYFQNHCLFLESGLGDQSSKAENVAQILQFLKQAKTHLHSRSGSLVEINLETNQKLHVVGDTHGQFLDTLEIFEALGNPSCDNKYLFLGDYVDRGRHQYENLMTLLQLQSLDECQSIFLLRGNHESVGMNYNYGFVCQLERRFADFPYVYECIESLFHILPLCAVINSGIFCCHGGIGVVSESNRTLEKFSEIRKCESFDYNENLDIQALEEIVEGILWSDPVEYTSTLGESSDGLRPNPRGGSTKLFGKDITLEFLRRNHLNGIIRSHESSKAFLGHKYEHDNKILTIFSCPQYGGQNNIASVATIFGSHDNIIEEEGKFELLNFENSVYFS